MNIDNDDDAPAEDTGLARSTDAPSDRRGMRAGSLRHAAKQQAGLHAARIWREYLDNPQLLSFWFSAGDLFGVVATITPPSGEFVGKLLLEFADPFRYPPDMKVEDGFPIHRVRSGNSVIYEAIFVPPNTLVGHAPKKRVWR